MLSGEGVDKVSDEVEKSQVFEKFEDSDDKVAKILDDAGKALTSLFDTIADKAEPMIKKTKAKIYDCLLYTSDAADELHSVDLGGRRSIKKKKTHNY